MRAGSFDRWRRAGAWFVVLATVVVAVATLVLHGGPGTSTAGEELSALTPLMSVVVGALVIVRRGNHPVGWLFCVSGLCWALYSFGVQVGDRMLHGGTFPAQELFIWTTSWTSIVALGSAPVLVMYVFPTGRLAAGTPRWMFRAAVMIIVLAAVGHAFDPGPLEDLPTVANPYALSGFIGATMSVIKLLGWPLLLVAIAGGIFSLRKRARHGSFTERQQIKWVLLAGMALLLFGCFWGITELIDLTHVAVALSGVFLPLAPLALGIAILRHRLYDIDVLINRTLVYASLSAVLAGVYLGTVVVFQRLLSTFTADSNIAIAASTLAVAAMFRPVRARIQHFIDRRFYRAKYDAAATIGRFSTRLRHEVDLDALEGELLGVIGQTLQPATAAVWLKTSEPAP